MEKVSKFKAFLNVSSLTILMLDSGGGLRLRNLAFLVIFMFAANGIYKYRAFNKNFLYMYLIFLVSLFPGVLTSIAGGIPVLQILNWIMSFLLIPFFYFYAKGSDLRQDHFVKAGVIFSSIVVLIFFGRLLNIGIIVSVNDYINMHSDGFFGDKNFLSGDILPNVYFQGTLSVIICGGLALKDKKYLGFAIILLGLILAPSRFGFMVLTLWAAFLFFRQSIFRLSLLVPIIFVAFIILQNLPFGNELFSVFTGESDALTIRNGHISSILGVFQDNILNFFFGQGPGSSFYSAGIGGFADNIEISQLEYIRKYGIISFLAFCTFYFFPLLNRYKLDIYVKGSLVLYFLVSSSNPVLFSLFSMLYVAFVYVDVFDHPKNDLCQHSLN